MKKYFYKWSKAFVNAYEKAQKEKEQTNKQRAKETHEKLRIEREHFNNRIKMFRNSYVDTMKSLFLETMKPKFNKGDVVTFNWYDKDAGDSWFGAISAIMAHTPYWGPTDVLVVDVVLDSSRLTEIIDQMHEKEEFDNKYTSHDLNYELFKQIVDSKLSKMNSTFCIYAGITWAYRVKVEKDPVDHWRYSLPEKFFVSSNSEVAKISKKCFALEVEINQKQNEKDKLKLDLQQEMSKLTSKMRYAQ